MSAGSLPKCCGFIILSAFRHFAECRKNLPVMKNANKSPKISHSAMVREWKIVPESVSMIEHQLKLTGSFD